jgi:hypothetical protein
VDRRKKYWFAAKPYGAGWGWGPPLSWAGWIATAVFLLLTIVGASLLPEHTLLFLSYLSMLALAFILLAVWKGEPQQRSPQRRRRRRPLLEW